MARCLGAAAITTGACSCCFATQRALRAAVKAFTGRQDGQNKARWCLVEFVGDVKRMRGGATALLVQAAVALSLSDSARGFSCLLCPCLPQRAPALRGGLRAARKFCSGGRRALGETHTFAAMRVITFDIDGTICASDKLTEGVMANAMHRGAFTHAFQAVCGFENASIDEVPTFHRCMCPCVLACVCARAPPKLS